MAQTANRLPNRFPVGSKYVVESSGQFVRRYVEFPNGGKIALPKRKAVPCTYAGTLGLVSNIFETEGTT